MKKLFLSFLITIFFVSVVPTHAAVLEQTEAGFLFEYQNDWVREDWTKRIQSTNADNRDVIAFYTFGKDTGLSTADVTLVVRDTSGDDYVDYLKDSVIHLTGENTVSFDQRVAIQLSGKKFGTREDSAILVVPLEKRTYELRYRGKVGREFSQLVSSFKLRPGFVDVWGHPHEDAILAVSEQGLVGGYVDGTFRPDKVINRAEFMKMLVLSDSDLTDAYMENWFDLQVGGKEYEHVQFYDVPVDGWFSKYILYGYHKGWIEGYKDGNFQPAQDINYAEAMKLILERRAESLELKEEGPWFLKYAEEMNSRGIIDLGESKTTFTFAGFDGLHGFADRLTRAGMAQFLYRYGVLDQNPKMQTFGLIQRNRKSFPEFDFGDIMWNFSGHLVTGDVVVRQVGFENESKVYDVVDFSGDEMRYAFLRIYSKEYDMGNMDVSSWVFLGENDASVFYGDFPICDDVLCVEVQEAIKDTVEVRH
jgi:hypothetical protein